jgi:hypothetical protein
MSYSDLPSTKQKELEKRDDFNARIDGFGMMDKYKKTAVLECDHQNNQILFCNRVYKNKKGHTIREQYYIKEIKIPNFPPEELAAAKEQIEKFKEVDHENVIPLKDFLFTADLLTKEVVKKVANKGFWRTQAAPDGDEDEKNS